MLAVLFVQFMQVTASIYLQNNARRKAASKANMAAAQSHQFQIDTDQLTYPPGLEAGKRKDEHPAHGSHHHDHAKKGAEANVSGHIHPHGEEGDVGHTHAIIFDARLERHVGTYILELGIASHR